MKTTIEQNVPTIKDIKNAAINLSGIAALTPLSKSITYSREYNANIQFKREDLQLTRSYKIRGAYHKIASLSKNEISNGVVCASAGNHAQGVAFSCNKLRIKGTIFMPSTCPKQKIEQVEWYGKKNIKLILTGDTFDDAQKEALIYAKSHKNAFIHPFDDPQIVEGQGTIALEILQQTKYPIDYLFIPVGGGGLAAGISQVFKSYSANTKIIGVEPAGAPSMISAFQKKHPFKLNKIDHFVDGAAVKKVGNLNYQICNKNLDDMLMVDEGHLCQHIIQLYNKEAIVVEPAGALSLAALDQYKNQIKDKNVICIVSGSNNDITRMEEIKERALIYKELKHYFLVKFPQRSGALKEFVTQILGPDDDITHFEYTQKHYRKKGYAVVGIEIKEQHKISSLISRMKLHNFYGDYLNKKESLRQILI